MLLVMFLLLLLLLLFSWVKIGSVRDERLHLLLLLLIPETYLQRLVEIGSGTAEILMTLSFCGGGGVKSFSYQTQLFS